MWLPEWPSEELVRVRRRCTSDHLDVFVLCIAGYKSVLMLVSAVLAWKTRHVDIAALNDSRQIGQSIHSTLVIGLVGLPAFWLVESSTARYLIQQVSLVLAVASIMSLLFVSKVRAVLRGKGAKQTKRRSFKSDEDFDLHDVAEMQRARVVAERQVDTLRRELDTVRRMSVSTDPSGSGSGSGPRPGAVPLSPSPALAPLPPLDRAAALLQVPGHRARRGGQARTPTQPSTRADDRARADQQSTSVVCIRLPSSAADCPAGIGGGLQVHGSPRGLAASSSLEHLALGAGPAVQYANLGAAAGARVCRPRPLVPGTRSRPALLDDIDIDDVRG